MIRLSNGSSRRNAATVSGAAASSRRAVKRNSPETISSTLPLVLLGLGEGPRRGHLLEADIARWNHPGHDLDPEPTRLHRRVLAADSSSSLGVAAMIERP